MHRTEGDGFVVEDGKNRFIDQGLPPVEGTVDTAEFNNALQEEFCNLIEMTGGTVAATAVADRAAGWHQIYDAIFTAEAVGTDALTDDAVVDDKLGDDLDFGHFVSGDIDITGTNGRYFISDYQFLLDRTVDTDNYSKVKSDANAGGGAAQVSLLRKNSGVESSSLWSEAGLEFREGTSVKTDIDRDKILFGGSGESLYAEYSRLGVKFYGGGSPGDVYPDLRTAVFELPTGGAWGTSGTTPTHYSYSGSLDDCGIPNGALVLSVSLNYQISTGSPRCAPIFCAPLDGTNSKDISLLTFEAIGGTVPDTSKPQYLTVVYDASDL